ncbi:MAG: hypothetical protein OEM85_17030 [Gammaproteobacteria bacterium]|nr:hypothetical protein [Gammaproteobacteria bacterium]MDH3409801.1 hypothetical protein [Gammaproteobacteria bacterium]
MSDLETLKDLLFGTEKQVLDSISERVESRELRSADVADILPEAIHASHRSGGELIKALREPVGACLQQEIRDDPQTYGDALYPVMGPAIRKYIMHALRTFTQQINEALEQSLTPKGLSWRVQAWRAGVPFGEFVVQKSLLYRVEQAYLISRENGLLVGHAQHEAARIKDSDAVSAMFTAIQDFVKESFSPDRTGRLESADMGEFTLWAVHGPHALLVCVIRGVPPRSLRADLSAILERIHFRYGDAIRTYSGDTASVPEVEEELTACLRLEARQDTGTANKGVSWPLLIILILVVGAFGYFAVTGWLQAQQIARLNAALTDTPGLYITDIYRDRQSVLVRGLRDPLAPTVSAVAAANGLSHVEIVADMQAFQSLDPTLLAQRAANRFGSPEGVSFAVEGSRLIVSGAAPVDWQEEVALAYRTLAGLDDIEFRMSPDERAEQAAAAPGVDLGQLDAIVRQLDGRAFYFASGTTLTAQSADALTAYADQLKAAAADLALLGRGLNLTATGFTDPVGAPEVNYALAQQRAEAIASALVELGWDGAIIARANPDRATDVSKVDPSLRRAIVELESVETEPTQ